MSREKYKITIFNYKNNESNDEFGILLDYKELATLKRFAVRFNRNNSLQNVRVRRSKC